ncbi:MAG: hypothetical protein ACJ8C4_15285 [Gemmataceae bacterium]
MPTKLRPNSRRLQKRNIESLLRQLDCIAKRPWLDLATEFDFCSLYRGLNLKPDYEPKGANRIRVGVAGFTTFGNPEVQKPGDFIHLGIDRRIDYWHKVIAEAILTLRPLKQSAKEKAKWNRISTMLDALHRDRRALAVLCNDDSESPRRRAATMLVQIYRAWRPDVTFAWLGEAGKPSNDRPLFQCWLEQFGQTAIAECAAQALVELSRLYRQAVSQDDLVEQAIESYSLVLVRGLGRREIFWKGQSVGDDWTKSSAQWAFLEYLVEALKFRLGVDGYQGDTPRVDLANARYRLSKVLPPNLDKLIQTAGVGSYRLHFDPGDAVILTVEQQEHVSGLK